MRSKTRRVKGRRAERRWGIVLAGGDGMRLKPLTRALYGDERPKQFCDLVNGRTLLHETLDRAALSIPVGRTLVSLNARHERWYSAVDRLCPNQCIVQPANRGTAPAVAHCVLSVAGKDDEAVVAILPSDHHYSDRELFTESLDAAFQCAAEHPQSVVLLGARADSPETDYGWIEPGKPAPGHEALFQVKAFREKPEEDAARALLESGALWNTFVMVGHARAFLDLFHAVTPELMCRLADAPLWEGATVRLPESCYAEIAPTDLSRRVLAAGSECLLVLRMGPMGWSDLGHPGRVAAVAASLERSGSPRVGAAPIRGEEHAARAGAR